MYACIYMYVCLYIERERDIVFYFCSDWKLFCNIYKIPKYQSINKFLKPNNSIKNMDRRRLGTF